MKRTCKKTKKWKFLFWSGVSTSYDHEWAYADDREHRKCVKCGRPEMLYAIDRDGSMSYRDWRLGKGGRK